MDYILGFIILAIISGLFARWVSGILFHGSQQSASIRWQTTVSLWVLFTAICFISALLEGFFE